MHPDRGIVRTYKRSVIISPRPDVKKTLTCQSANTNNAPRDPLHGPVKWNPAETWTYSTLRLHLRLRLHLQPCASPPPSRSPRVLHRCVKSPPTVTSCIRRCHYHRHTQFRAGSRFRFDSTQLFFDLIGLNCSSI